MEGDTRMNDFVNALPQIILGTVYSCLLILALLAAQEILERMRLK